MQPWALSRRRFILSFGFGTTALGFGSVRGASPDEPRIMTVLGPIRSSELGRTLAHEHAVVDFIGAEKTTSPRYDVDAAFKTVHPHLARLKQHGVRSFIECTPAYIGRNVELLKRLSRASGLHILTNTGYYGAAGNKFLPKHAYSESADELARRWSREATEGVDESGVRPGFIKLGVEKGKLSELHVKLVRAGARAHLQSGLTIAIHTGNGEAALDELRVLKEEGVAPSALVWVHAQNDAGPTHLEMAKRGAWVSLDGYNPKNHARYKGWLSALKAEKLLNRVLLSHDHFWSVEGEASNGSLRLSAGGETNAFEALFTRLLPDLHETGFTQGDIDQLLMINPREAFTVRVQAA